MPLLRRISWHLLVEGSLIFTSDVSLDVSIGRELITLSMYEAALNRFMYETALNHMLGSGNLSWLGIFVLLRRVGWMPLFLLPCFS